MHVASQDDLFPSLPARSVEPTVREEYNRFRKEFDRLGGILPVRVASAFLGVSRQRVHQLIDAKQVRSVNLIDTIWVSLSDVVERTTSPKPVRGLAKK
jgi:hypothetical protein